MTREDYFFIKCDYKYEKINVNDILYIQATAELYYHTYSQREVHYFNEFKTCAGEPRSGYLYQGSQILYRIYP